MIKDGLTDLCLNSSGSGPTRTPGQDTTADTIKVLEIDQNAAMFDHDEDQQTPTIEYCVNDLVVEEMRR